jgi:hypothetical protein
MLYSERLYVLTLFNVSENKMKVCDTKPRPLIQSSNMAGIKKRIHQVNTLPGSTIVPYIVRKKNSSRELCILEVLFICSFFHSDV